MINDILEQVAEDYFRSKGYFTQHNVKYRPSIKNKKYSVHSDIDILGIHPLQKGKSRVIVGSCKSWQVGLNIESELGFLENRGKIISGREYWKTFRELADKTWAKALKDKVKELTGQNTFIFYLIVTRYEGDKNLWENFPLFKGNLINCDIRLISLETILSDLYELLDTTPAHSELSRLLQLIKADNGKIIYERKN